MFSKEGKLKKFELKPLAPDEEESLRENEKTLEMRQRTFQKFAKITLLSRKNELGLILDLVSSCLDLDPQKRPTIMGLLNSPIF